MSVEGRMYPVEIAYLAAPTSDYVSAAVQVICDIHVHVGFVLLQLEIDQLLTVMSSNHLATSLSS